MQVFISEGGGDGLPREDQDAMVQFQLDNFQMPRGYGHQYDDDGDRYDDGGQNGNDYNEGDNGYDGLNDEGEYEEV